MRNINKLDNNEVKKNKSNLREYTGTNIAGPIGDIPISGDTRTFFSNSVKTTPTSSQVCSPADPTMPVDTGGKFSKEEEEQLRRKVIKLKACKENVMDISCLRMYNKTLAGLKNLEFSDKVLELPISDYDWKAVQPALKLYADCFYEIQDIVGKMVEINTSNSG